MTKQYLTGTLTSSEKYRLEDRILEHDFSFEAMEGLEHVPWQQCEKHLLETESRIIEEFSLKRSAPTKTILISLAGLLTSALLATWYFGSGNDPVDLRPTEEPTAQPAAADSSMIESEAEQSEPLLKLDSTTTEEVLIADNSPIPDDEPPVVQNKVEPAQPATKLPLETKSDDVVHIAVGRIMDIKGIAIANATVKSGNQTDTTDKHGYFALKVPMGGAEIIVSHLATEYTVEIDTNQNWEIILDIAQRTVHDYSPTNAANRFK